MPEASWLDRYRCLPDLEYCVTRSSNIDKDSREQFEIRTHKRLIDIQEPTSKAIDALTQINVASGVEIDIKL